ncbi:MAG: hypothetical protein HY778_15680 [Betaproteobacteria bacterium]|nr:hypothetical protein [Betaproteobacteria bacterium]
MEFEVCAFAQAHRMGESATRPIARLPGRLAALRIKAGGGPAASSRLASRRMLPNPGSRGSAVARMAAIAGIAGSASKGERVNPDGGGCIRAAECLHCMFRPGPGLDPGLGMYPVAVGPKNLS